MKLGYFAAIVVLGTIIGIQWYSLHTADMLIDNSTELIAIQDTLINALRAQVEFKERTITMQSELCWEGSI